MEELGASSECEEYMGELEVKRKELKDVYEKFTQNLGTFLEDLDGMLSMITEMKYGFKEKDLLPGGGSFKQCIFPPDDIQKFLQEINNMDGELSQAFMDLGNLKRDLIRIAKTCEKPSGQSLLRRRLEQMDNELGALIYSKVFFNHPLDEIEEALPVDLLPEDKKFVEVLVDCTTQFPEKLLQNLSDLREVGRPYDFE
jgi:hypothetical protein